MTLGPCSLGFSLLLEAASRKLLPLTSQSLWSGSATAWARLMCEGDGPERCLVKELTVPVALWPAGRSPGPCRVCSPPFFSIWDPWGLLIPGPQYFLFPCKGTLSRASAYWPAAHILGLISTKSNAFKSPAEPPGQGTACRADSCEGAVGWQR